jgi:hypothetical protein
MNNKTESTDPEIAAITRALRRASDRALRLAKATRTPFWVMKNGRIVNLNPDAKGCRKIRPAATKPGKGAKLKQKGSASGAHSAVQSARNSHLST